MYAFKQGLHAIGTVTSVLGPFGSVIRKITECVGPSFAFCAHCKSLWQEAAKPFDGLVEALDILDIIGDANYFFNGGGVPRAERKGAIS